MRIPKSLEEKTRRERTRGAEIPHLQGREKGLRGKERPGEREGDWTICDESMAEGSMVSDYCQGLLLKEYHSNGAGRSWGLRELALRFSAKAGG